MASAQVGETSVNVINDSSFQNYSQPDDHTRQTTDTPGFQPFTKQQSVADRGSGQVKSPSVSLSKNVTSSASQSRRV